MTEDVCDVFNLDHYVPTADGTIPVPDDYTVFLCFERFTPDTLAETAGADYMENVILASYRE